MRKDWGNQLKCQLLEVHSSAFSPVHAPKLLWLNELFTVCRAMSCRASTLHLHGESAFVAFKVLAVEGCGPSVCPIL